MNLPRTRLLAVAACVAATVPFVGASPASAATCGSLGKYPGSGYFTTLSVSKISCTGGKAVMRGHHKCRTKNGIRGRCRSFNGWRCTETRQAIATEYNARVTCKKDGRRVVYTYQQDT